MNSVEDWQDTGCGIKKLIFLSYKLLFYKKRRKICFAFRVKISRGNKKAVEKKAKQSV